MLARVATADKRFCGSLWSVNKEKASMLSLDLISIKALRLYGVARHGSGGRGY